MDSRLLSVDAASRRSIFVKNIAKSGGAGKVEILNVALGDRETSSKYFFHQVISETAAFP